MSLLLLFSGAGSGAAVGIPRGVLLARAGPFVGRRAEVAENLAVMSRPVRLRVGFRPRGPLVARRNEEPGALE